MNFYATTAKFLCDSFESNQSVNTVIFGEVENIDLEKATIFPLVNIEPITWELSENRIDMTFTVTVVNMRESNNKPSKKIFGDNLIDNLGEASTILAQEITTLELTRNEFDITLESATPNEKIEGAFNSYLDGWQTTIVLSIQNEMLANG